MHTILIDCIKIGSIYFQLCGIMKLISNTDHRIRSENLMNRKIVVNKTCTKLSERKLESKSEIIRQSISKFQQLHRFDYDRFQNRKTARISQIYVYVTQSLGPYNLFYIICK